MICNFSFQIIVQSPSNSMGYEYADDGEDADAYTDGDDDEDDDDVV